MPFRAVHRHWGTIFAHLSDLGCGHDWHSIWRVRPPPPITCDECGHPVHAKVSRTGLRFFAHSPGAPECNLARESLAHHLLKLELATAAQDAGVHAEMEVPAADGSWRADVLASDPSGTWTMALEAQLSPITAADIRVRTERMQSDQVGVCWFSDRPKPPWLGVVPSVRLTQSDDDRRLLVVEGLYSFSLPCWQGVPNVPLIEFLRWVFTGKAVPHEPRIHRGRPRPTEWIWTAAQYVQAEDAQLAELAAAERDRQAAKAEQARKLAGIHAQNAISRADVLQEATAVEAITRDVPGTGRRREKVLALRPMLNEALTLLTSKYGIDATLGWDLHNRRRYALGDPLVNSDGVPVAVFGPVPELVRGPAFLLLAGLLLLFPTSEQHDRFVKAMRKAKRTPAEEFRTDFLT